MMSELIVKLRKEKGLTQRMLAEELGVTDKAVSKWERGISCPDIALVAPLAKVLGVSTGELLAGELEQNTKDEQKAVEIVVDSTLKYAEHVKRYERVNARKIIGTVFSALCLIGIIVCIICNLAISQNLTWAWYPILSTIYGWVVIFPAIWPIRKGIRLSLLILTISTVPFLIGLDMVLGGTDLLVSLGIPCAVIGFVFLWGVYFLAGRMKKRPVLAAAISVLAAIPFQLLYGLVISFYIDEPIIDVWDVMSDAILLLIAVILYAIDHHLHRRHR